jgi:hypothetical protein
MRFLIHLTKLCRVCRLCSVEWKDLGDRRIDKNVRGSDCAYFKVVGQNLSRGTEENHENHSQDRFMVLKPISEPSEHEAGMLTFQL